MLKNKNKLVAKIDGINDGKFFSENYIDFFKNPEMTEKHNFERLNDLSVFLISPWTEDACGYIIEKEIDKYLCIYYTYVYDGVSAYIYMYGESKEQSLKKCKEFLEYLECTYNPEKERM